jgi:hypothetical protein
MLMGAFDMSMFTAASGPVHYSLVLAARSLLVDGGRQGCLKVDSGAVFRELDIA